MRGYLEMTISRRNKVIDGEFLRQSRMLSEAKKSKMSRSKSRHSENKSASPDKKEKKAKKNSKGSKSKSPTKSPKKKAKATTKSISPKKQSKLKKDLSLPQLSNSSEKVPHSRSVMKTNVSMMDKLISQPVETSSRSKRPVKAAKMSSSPNVNKSVMVPKSSGNLPTSERSEPKVPKVIKNDSSNTN